MKLIRGIISPALIVGQVRPAARTSGGEPASDAAIRIFFAMADRCGRIFTDRKSSGILLRASMTKEEIGFKHGIPVNPNKTWEKEINGRTFSFKKTLQRKGLFIYNCQRREDYGSITTASSTGFYSERDLRPDEIERLPQFADFISAHTLVR